MIRLLPQFAALLALTATSVRGAPHTSSHHDRRFVIDAELPGLVHAHVARDDSSFEQVGESTSNVDSSIEGVYVMPLQASSTEAFNEDANKKARFTPIDNPSRLLRVRRRLEDPIDEPDREHGERVKAQEEGEQQDQEDDDQEESSLSKRQYFIDGVNAPGLIVSHLSPSLLDYLSHEVALLDVHRRGLLDPIVPILGSLPGVGGVVSIIVDTLGNLLSGLPIVGPLLGGLLLSPHKSASAQGVDGAPATFDYYLDASSIRNASAIYLVDSGRPSPFALAAQAAGTNDTINEQLVSLQMAFVDPKTGKVQAYCATFKGSDDGQSEPAALTAQPCINDGMSQEPHPSQLWGFNPSNMVVRPMWNVQDAGNAKSKRAYIVQSAGGQNATVSELSGDGMDKVVLVFKPWEVDTNSTQPGAMYDPQEAGNWQFGLGNGTAGDASPAGSQAMAEDMGEMDEGVPVFIAGTGNA
ncbi:hypothetical protein RSOLAG22IIIB_06077 [Rhizoctonia solani]|uniref:Uncharacterized protein n=1 Tax=Rhizoctonia solani TaxID=456999 RepID=A0A0K6GBD5_9AGAM|nr:hypothetical protein RSOLAG22IIIB_06077 [Rhizoctonia solani]